MQNETLEEQVLQQQTVLDALPAVQAAWTARASTLETALAEENDPAVRRTTLNSAAQESLVPIPEGLGQVARLRFEGKVNAIRTAALAPLYETFLP